MKTLKESTKEFVQSVKEELDNASWYWEASCSNMNMEDPDKACSYLETQKFSHNVVKEALKEVWEDFIYNVRSEKLANADCPKYAARMIADRLAHQRINRYSVDQSRYRNYYDSKKWWIHESVSFHIQ
jgi:hypothetical protein